MKQVSAISGVLIFVVITTGFSQDTLWTRAYGGTGNDFCYSVCQTGGGGFVMGGVTSSYGAGLYDLYLLATDANGDSMWSTIHGDPGQSESVSCMQLTEDNGFILVGTAEASTLDNDMYMVKFDSVGDHEWSSYLGDEDLEEIATWVEQTNDGGYILTGHYWAPVTTYDFCMLKTTDLGIEIWRETFSWWNADYANCIRQTADHGYIIAGETSSNPEYEYDLLLIKTDALGFTEWEQRYGGSEADGADCVQQTSDGGYIVVGYTETYGAGGKDLWVIKTDDEGDTVWTRTFGGDYHDAACSVIQTSDGGYLVVGGCSILTSFDAYFVRLDADGDTLWTRIYGGNASDNARDVKQTVDGGYIVAGTTNSYGSGGTDIYLLRFAPDQAGVEDLVTVQLPGDIALYQNYPNPFNPATTITYTLPAPGMATVDVFNVMGQRVTTLSHGWHQAGTYRITFDASRLSSGIYYYSLTAGEYVGVKKMLLMK